MLKRLAGRDYHWAITLLASLLALGLYLYVTAPGLAGTADTYHYISAAYSLQHTGHLLLADGTPYQWWPPLFALVLRIIGAAEGVRWLNGLALLGTLVAWSAVGFRLLPARRVWALPLLLALGSPALAVSKFIWSEPLFMWLWASYFLVLLAWLRRGSWGLGMLATALGCLLPLQRIAGIFLLAGVGVGLAWPGTRQVARPGCRALVAHLAGVSSGLVVWQLHRSVVGGLSAAPLALAPVAADYGFVLGRWLVPLPLAWLRAGPATAWGLGLLVLVGLLWPQGISKQPVSSRWSGSWVLLSTRLLFAAFALSLLLLVASVVAVRAGPGIYEAERFLAVLYPLLVLLVLLAWPSQRRWAARAGPVLLAAWLVYQGVRVGHNAQSLRQLRPVKLTYPHPAAFWEAATSRRSVRRQQRE